MILSFNQQKILLFFSLFCLYGLINLALLSAAPLAGGYPLAPSASASPEEKARAFEEARLKVINAAKKYEKTPYKYGGLDRNGLDCSGFIFVSFKDALGIMPPRTTQGLYTWVEKIPREKAQPGDLLFFKTTNTGRISHAAIYLGDGRFIHSASDGPHTGVIYSSFNDRYWARTFDSAGRAFPEANRSINSGLAGRNQGTPATTSPDQPRPNRETLGTSQDESSSNLLLYAGMAPTWKAFLTGADIFRGFASHFGIGVTTTNFGREMHFGFMIRPEYDGAMDIFRLPFTFSVGLTDKVILFAGPVLGFGDAAISTDDGKRSYSGGTSWLGAIGLTLAPFKIETGGGTFSPYMETAWQHYLSEEKNDNINADFSAGFRFSTGVRWSLKVR